MALGPVPSSLGDDSLVMGQRDSYQNEHLNSVQGDPNAPADDAWDAGADKSDVVTLPLLGQATVATHQKRLLILLAVGVLVLALMALAALVPLTLEVLVMVWFTVWWRRDFGLLADLQRLEQQ